jgi:hypothetical protein
MTMARQERMLALCTYSRRATKRLQNDRPVYGYVHKQKPGFEKVRALALPIPAFPTDGSVMLEWEEGGMSLTV